MGTKDKRISIYVNNQADLKALKNPAEDSKFVWECRSVTSFETVVIGSEAAVVIMWFLVKGAIVSLAFNKTRSCQCNDTRDSRFLNKFCISYIKTSELEFWTMGTVWIQGPSMSETPIGGWEPQSSHGTYYFPDNWVLIVCNLIVHTIISQQKISRLICLDCSRITIKPNKFTDRTFFCFYAVTLHLYYICKYRLKTFL